MVCHQITSISTAGVRETTLADLALIRANCLRISHLKFDGQYLPTDDLRIKMECQKKMPFNCHSTFFPELK